MKYEYLEEMKKDILNYILPDINLSDFDSLDELSDEIYEISLHSDSITGLPSGSYFSNSGKAEKALYQNLDLLEEAGKAFGLDDFSILKSEENDTVIRCYLLSKAISEVLEEIEEEKGGF